MSDADVKEVTILSLACEGGGLDLIGFKDQRGRRFQVRIDDSAIYLLTEEDAAGLSPRTVGPWVRSWKEAWDRIEVQYPYWRSLTPIHVEPTFRRAILVVLTGRNVRPNDPINWYQWAKLLFSLSADDEWAVRGAAERLSRLVNAGGRILGWHPVQGGPIIATKGRYGPYISHNRIHVSIPADRTLDKFTLPEAVSLLDARATRLRRLRLRRPQKDVRRTGPSSAGCGEG